MNGTLDSDLARVALGAGCDHVVPGVRATARERLYVVTRQTLLAVQVVPVLGAVLAPVVVARKENSVRYMLSQPTRYLDELNEPDNQRIRVLGLLRAELPLQVSFHDLRLLGDDQDESPLYRHQGHRLVAGVKS